MQLNHINLVVPDVRDATLFFEKYFGFRCVGIKGDNIVAILKGLSDFTLVIMAPKDNDVHYPAAFHIGFMQDSIEHVAGVYARLKADGIGVGQEPRHIRDSFGFYFTFQTIMIEVGHYME